MDAQYAWQILHAEIRGRANDDNEEHPRSELQLRNLAALIARATAEVPDFYLIMELAGFGATFAQMTSNDPLTVAKPSRSRS